jgi:hypothetical protein
VLLAIGNVAQAEVVCKLHIEGFGYQQGLKKAHVSCTGGSIKAVAHSLLAPLVGAKAGLQSSGVQWLDSCEQGWTNPCLLVVCADSKARFPSATVLRVNTTAISNSTKLLLCMGTNTSVMIEGATFEENAVRAVTAMGKLHIARSNFTNSIMLGDGVEGGCLYSIGGVTVVESSRFVSNINRERGGAIGVTGGARLTITSCLFEGNQGGY